MIDKAPTYISLAEVNQPPNYSWPETGGVDMFEGKENIKTGGSIWFTTERARMAIHIAISEWIVWRFEGISENYPLSRLYVESKWASMIDPLYYSADDSVKGKFVRTGTLEEPLYSAITQMADHSGQMYRTNASDRVTESLLLAAHVLPDKKPFGKWLKTILERMHEHHYCDVNIRLTKEEKAMPRGDERVKENGSPIPRIAFDPEHDYNPDNSPALLHEFLQSLDHTQNPYLCSPELMLERGFVGTPYTYTPKV